MYINDYLWKNSSIVSFTSCSRKLYTMNYKAIYAVTMVYVGCGLNNVFLEYIIKKDPGCGHLITVLQFVFIAIHGFIFTSKFGTRKRKIGLHDYFYLVLLFFITNTLNNWAFDFNIPVPLHMIFRAGSLIANMMMGIWILKKKYPLSKYMSVCMITVGIIICTLATNKETTDMSCKNCDSISKPSDDTKEYFFWWIIGIIILTSALLLSALMGIYQEFLTSRNGKNPEEALYYTHLLSLPGFIIYYNSIISHAEIANQSDPYNIPFINMVVPLVWLYLIGNVITQYMCISSVYILTTECSALTLTLIITLRKFFSLLFSIIYFENPFTFTHWMGTILVFSGTLIFTEVPQKVSEVHYFKKFKKE